MWGDAVCQYARAHVKMCHLRHLPFITNLRLLFSCFNPSRTEPQTVQAVLDLAEQLQPLWDEIRRYTSLKRLEVDWHEFKPGDEPVYRIIVDNLLRTIHRSVDGRLNQLTWFIPHLKQSIPESSQLALNLQNLFVRGFGAGGRVPRTSIVGNVVLHNPGNRFLSLSYNSRYPMCRWEDLFPVALDQIVVEKIRIEGYLPSSSELSPSPLSTLPKAPHLKELHVSVNPGYATGRQSGVNIDALWITLKNSSTRLSRLTLGYGLQMSSQSISPPIADYHTGNSRFVFPQPPPIAIQRDWVCPDSHWEGIAINPSIWPAPSLFAMLEMLAIVSPPTWDLTASRLQCIVDYVMEMPVLHSFEVGWLHLKSPSTNDNTGTSSVRRAEPDDFQERIDSIKQEVFLKRCALSSLGISMIGDSGQWSATSAKSWAFRRSSGNDRDGNGAVSGPDGRFPENEQVCPSLRPLKWRALGQPKHSVLTVWVRTCSGAAASNVASSSSLSARYLL